MSYPDSTESQMERALCRRFCVAPMMDWTDRHERFFLRSISHHTLLYTEMVTTGALLYGDRERFLRFDFAEHPVALQLGGCNPQELALCAQFGEQYGYDEINLNVGCPSNRVQAARIGACLMQKPGLVAECFAAMTNACHLPVTIKCRIGIDDQDSYEFFRRFVTTVADSGCRTFIIHARKAVLQGLNPKENREVPPLHYDYVYRLKQSYPDLEVIINGGIESLDQAELHLRHVDGVMLGRAAYRDPYLLATVDQRFFADSKPLANRRDIALSMLDYIETQLAHGIPLKAITRHMLGLYKGQHGAKAWRRILSEQSARPGTGIDVLLTALDAVTAEPENIAA